MDLATGQLVEVGMAVGMIVKSIGEPGTQLTMRSVPHRRRRHPRRRGKKRQETGEGKVKFVGLNIVINDEGKKDRPVA